MHEIRKAGVVFLSLLTFAAMVLGVYEAIHSSLFLVQVVEIETDSDPGAQPAAEKAAAETAVDPVDAETISNLAAVPIGRANLFSLDLSQVESRILSNDWVRAVTLQKRFPQTLSITVSYRKPLALVQRLDGSLSYLDRDARPFGKVNLAYQPDLPVFVGLGGASAPVNSQARASESPDLHRALELLNRWNGGPVGHFAQLASLAWEPERGFHAIAIYPLKERRPGARTPTLSRTIVDLGGGSQSDDGAQMARLAEVFHYLRDNSVPARQIWADAGKKIVVKTARGS